MNEYTRQIIGFVLNLTLVALNIISDINQLKMFSFTRRHTYQTKMVNIFIGTMVQWDWKMQSQCAKWADVIAKNTIDCSGIRSSIHHQNNHVYACIKNTISTSILGVYFNANRLKFEKSCAGRWMSNLIRVDSIHTQGGMPYNSFRKKTRFWWWFSKN